MRNFTVVDNEPLKKQTIMLELKWYEGLDVTSNKKNWYVRSVTKQMLDIHELALHMEAHHTPFTVGTIEGLLTDFVRCIREQLLAGNSVKIGDLAIFKLSTESRPYADVGGLAAATGQFAAQARVGSAVKSVKLLATATGRSMRAPLGRDVELAWSTEAKAMMEERRKEVLGDGQE